MGKENSGKGIACKNRIQFNVYRIRNLIIGLEREAGCLKFLLLKYDRRY